MKRNALILAAALVVGVLASIATTQVVIEQRDLTNAGLTRGMSFGTALPTVANDGRGPFHGEPFIVRSSGADPLLRVYDESESTADPSHASLWETTPMLETVNDWTNRQQFNVTRQEFNQSCLVREAADFSAELVTDAAVNVALCPSGGGPDQGINMFEFRIDGAQASPFIVDAAGALDIDNDSIANEGVEIVVAPTSAPVGGVVDVGTSPETYFQVGLTIASIDGADSYGVGWRLAAAYVDNMVIGTVDTGGAFHWDDALGNCVIATQDDGTDGADEQTTCDLSDAEEIHVRVHVNTDGTFDFFHAATEALLDVATELTQTNATGAGAAGDMLVPYIWMLQDTAADTEIKILYVEIGEVQS
jgi:hypothetical protein